MTDDHERELRRRAEKRADAKIGFRIHLLVYLVVNTGLFAINMMTSRNYMWFAWPLFGWGIGLLAHGLAVYGGQGDGRERMIEAELEKLRGKR